MCETCFKSPELWQRFESLQEEKKRQLKVREHARVDSQSIRRRRRRRWKGDDGGLRERVWGYRGQKSHWEPHPHVLEVTPD